MSHFSVIRLYSVILSPVYCDWINAVDLCKLDTAVCNNTLRPYLLAAMSKCCLLHYEEGDLMGWIAMRGMGVRKWEIGASLSELDRQVLTRSGYLKELNVYEMQYLSEVLDVCPVVHALKIEETTDEEFLKVLPRLGSVFCLIMSYSELTEGINHAIVEHLPGLREFQTSCAAIEVVEGCKHLEAVACKYSSTVLTALLNLNLLSLSFCYDSGHTLIDDDVIPLLSRCSSLEKFIVRDTQLTDAFTASLARLCPRLSVFDMGDSLVSDETLLALAQHCPLLNELRIASNAVTDNGVITVVDGCPLLSYLSVDNCPHLTDNCFLHILQSCRKLTYLSACNTRNVTDAAFCDAFSVCPTLEILNAYSVSDQCSFTSKVMTSNMVDLHSLDYESSTCTIKHSESARQIEVSFSVPMTASDHRQIFAQSPNLQRISLIRDDVNLECIKAMIELCPCVTDIRVWLSSIAFDGLIDVIKAYPKLKHLAFSASSENEPQHCIEQVFSTKMEWLTYIHLHQCPINDVCLDEMGEYCINLEKLVLVTIKNITSTGVTRLLRMRSSVSMVMLDGCPLLDMEILRSIVEMGRRFHFLGICDCWEQQPEDVTELEYLKSCLSPLVKKLKLKM